MFIDSHTHLADAAFATDVADVIARAHAAGARALVCIGESPDAADRSVQLVRAYPGRVFHTAGVHPHDADRFVAERDLPRLRHHLHLGAVAVGECGLDYFYDSAPRQRQREVLAAQVALAGELRRPLVVHSREAVNDTMAMIRDAQTAGVQGVLHCHTGPQALAAIALEAGWYISFSGIVTFGRWSDDDLIRSIPGDRLLVESDAPYLAPVPHRGKRNEPALVTFTLAKVAQVRGETVDVVGTATTQNTMRLFGLALEGTSA